MSFLPPDGEKLKHLQEKECDEECEDEEESYVPFHTMLLSAFTASIPIILFNVVYKTNTGKQFLISLYESIFQHIYFPTTFNQVSKTLIYQLIMMYVSLQIPEFLDSRYSLIALIISIIIAGFLLNIQILFVKLRFRYCEKLYKENPYVLATDANSFAPMQKKSILENCKKQISRQQVIYAFPAMILGAFLFTLLVFGNIIFFDFTGLKNIMFGKFDNRYIIYQRATVDVYVQSEADNEKFKQLMMLNRAPDDIFEKNVYYSAKNFDNIDFNIYSNLFPNNHPGPVAIFIKIYDGDGNDYNINRHFILLAEDNLKLRKGGKYFISVLPHSKNIAFIHPAPEGIFPFKGKIRFVYKDFNSSYKISYENLYGLPFKDIFVSQEKYEKFKYELISGNFCEFRVSYDEVKDRFIFEYCQKFDRSN